MKRIFGVIVWLLIVGGLLLAVHQHTEMRPLLTGSLAPRAIDLDRWLETAAAQYRRPWPTGFDTVLISRIPNPLNRTFYVGVQVNGVSPCPESGVCRR